MCQNCNIQGANPAAIAPDEPLWQDSYIVGLCDICGDEKRVIHSADPDAVDIYDEVGDTWLCRKCYLGLCETASSTES